MSGTVAFALPTLSSSDMTKDDQGALIVNQATAAIVAAWLEHATAMVQNGSSSGAFTVTRAELVSLVNDVQEALRTF
jgi:hypothetical protein